MDACAPLDNHNNTHTRDKSGLFHQWQSAKHGVNSGIWSRKQQPIIVSVIISMNESIFNVDFKASTDQYQECADNVVRPY